MATREEHRQGVMAACREIGAEEVLTLVAGWTINELLPAPHIQQRIDVQDRVLECARTVARAAHKMLA